MTSHNKKHTDDNDIEIIEETSSTSSFKPKKESDLKAELVLAKKQAQEYLAGWQRAQADLINFKKDTEESRKKSVQFATEDFIAQCIPVLDSFDMAFRNKEAWEQAPENWRKGVEYIYSQFLSILAGNGVTQLSPLGEPFNPSEHDSAGTIPVDTVSREGIILDVIQRGYRLHDKLIRAPKVIIGHYQA